jgi:hypothetical protein
VLCLYQYSIGFSLASTKTIKCFLYVEGMMLIDLYRTGIGALNAHHTGIGALNA